MGCVGARRGGGRGRSGEWEEGEDERKGVAGGGGHAGPVVMFERSTSEEESGGKTRAPVQLSRRWV